VDILKIIKIFILMLVLLLIKFAAEVSAIEYRDDELIKAIKGFMPENGQLYSEDYEISTKDLDKDGRDELLVPFKVKAIDNAVFLLVLKNINNSLERIGVIKGDGYEIDKICFTDIQGDGLQDILYGVRISKNFNLLNGYTLVNGKLDKIFNKTYSKFDIIEKTATDKKSSLAVWTWDREEAFRVEIINWSGKEFIATREHNRNYYKKVVDYYEEKIKNTPYSATYWYYMAEAQAKAGLKKEALESISKGLGLNQEYPSKQQFDELKRNIL
jgi:tetratricopeptide (TPR) repeat protein